MSIKAIETAYKGYRFRSRLEARYAVMFDALGFEWQYEPEGFDLGEMGYYLPDFFLPKLNVWIEIKGGKATGVELAKCGALFAGKTGEVVATDFLMMGDETITRAVFEEFTCEAKDRGITGVNVHHWFCDAGRDINAGREHVFLFEGLLDNAHMCLGGSRYVQGAAEGIIHHLLGHNTGTIGYNCPKIDLVPIMANAIIAARSARFEHGEKP